jgi:hypothetical protein
MRDTEPDGLCPVKDKAPRLLPANELVYGLYKQAQTSAEYVQGRRRTLAYLKPTEVEALMSIRDIKPEKREETLNRLFILQDLENEMRPARRR